MPRYAAVDIGSNSIRMLAAEVNPPEPMRVVASDREVVRLGTSVFRQGRLDPAAIELSIQVLSRMATEYRRLGVVGVKAVGTAALRDASNQSEFLERAEEVLGTHVEVVSGLEEARLIHMGVQARWPETKQRVLILDIGGGSGELILSEHGHLVESFSKPLGAVRLTELFLKADPPDPREVLRMQKYIQERIAGPVARFNSMRFDRMICTSSTAAAVVCAVNRVRRSKRDTADRMQATAPQIRELLKEVTSVNLSLRQKITGIGPRRAEIIVAGVAVLNEVMQELHIPRMYYSVAGVRDGIIADLAHGRAAMEQSRLDADQRRMVRALAKHYGANPAHIRKVAEIACTLFDHLRSLHKLPPASGRVLEAAAHLFGIGHFVNESRHHKHSLYLVANSDLPGFGDRERLMIANLSRYHRKSMPQPSHEVFQLLDPQERRTVFLLIPLLRLAIAMDQSHEQRVDRVETSFAATGTIEICLCGNRDLDIERWHAQSVTDIFRDVYGLPLKITTSDGAA